jgi:hypothetical protein
MKALSSTMRILLDTMVTARSVTRGMRQNGLFQKTRRVLYFGHNNDRSNQRRDKNNEVRGVLPSIVWTGEFPSFGAGSR